MTDTLLIIEDKALLGGELTRHYRRAGWEVVHATALADAKRLLLDKNLEPLVVLSDMNLPDGSALGLLERFGPKRRLASGYSWRAMGQLPIPFAGCAWARLISWRSRAISSDST